MLRTRLALTVVLLAASVPTAAAQSLSTLPRATVSTGLNDSTLTMVADSARRTRASDMPQFRKMLSLRGFDSLVTAGLRLTGTATLTGATITGAPTWSTLQTFAANQRVDSATGAARAQKLTTARTIFGQSFDGTANVTGAITATTGAFSGAITVASCTGCGGGGADPSLLGNGSAAAPSYSFTNSTGLGLYRFGADTLGIATGGSVRGHFNSAGLTLTAGVGTPSLQFGTTQTGIGSRGDSIQFYGNGGYRWAIAPGGTLKSFVGSTVIEGGAGNMTVTAGTGNSRTMTLQSTTSAGTAKNTLLLGADSTATFLGNLKAGTGTASLPSFSWSNDPNTGMYSLPADSIGFTTGGSRTFSISGSGGQTSLVGPAANMKIVAGTGNSRVLTLQGTSSSGTAATSGTFYDDSAKIASTKITNAGVMANLGSAAAPSHAFDADRTTGFYRYNTDTLAFASGSTPRLLFANQGATGAGDVNLCVTTTGVTKVITQGATCGSSTEKVKTDISTLFGSTVTSKTMALRPTAYSYVPSVYAGRSEFGLIAEEVAKVDPRLAFYSDRDEVTPNGKQIRKGDPINVNDRAVLSLLLAEVQNLRREVDSLRAAVKGKP